jgi:hypothetical protein
MLQKAKIGAIALIASAAIIGSAHAQSSSITIPVPTSDPAIGDVVTGVKGEMPVREIMNAKRAEVIVQQAAAMPLMDQVMAQMMNMMKNRIMQTQMNALKNPDGGIPGAIAPPMF